MSWPVDYPVYLCPLPFQSLGTWSFLPKIWKKLFISMSSIWGILGSNPQRILKKNPNFFSLKLAIFKIQQNCCITTMSMKVLETLKILPSSPTSLLSPLALSRALPLATGRDVNKRHSLRRGISATMGSYYFYSVWPGTIWIKLKNSW